MILIVHLKATTARGVMIKNKTEPNASTSKEQLNGVDFSSALDVTV